MSDVIVTKALATVGLAVMRGRDWKFGDQDKFQGNKGTIISIGGSGNKEGVPEGWVSVKWENGDQYNYQVEGHFANQKKYDLYVYRKTDSVKVVSTSSGKSCGGYEGNFREGEIVYVRHEKDPWIRDNNMERDTPYIVSELNHWGSKNSVKLKGPDHPYWIADSSLMTKEQWLKESAKTRQKSIEEARSGLEELSRAGRVEYDPGVHEVQVGESIYKPNINITKNEHRNTEPIKVRRPISTIKGPKRRSRT